jgi:ABC-type multidrug transport system fused ATPase/permease subunit
VFEGTLRENLTFGEPVPDADLRRAIELAALEPVLSALPNRLDTAISERGLNFSGGQKQRIALARGLVAARHSSLVFLDEPTASLDPVSEAGIYAGLDRALPDVCLVSSIHRLHLLARFDRVVLMAEGRVVDAGTLPELLARQPLMQQLWHEAGSAAEGAPQEVGARPSPIG